MGRSAIGATLLPAVAMDAFTHGMAAAVAGGLAVAANTATGCRRRARYPRRAALRDGALNVPSVRRLPSRHGATIPRRAAQPRGLLPRLPSANALRAMVTTMGRTRRQE